MKAFDEVVKAVTKQWCVLLLCALVVSRADEPGPLKLVKTVPLPDVKGRIDHLAIDTHGKRLFVAALGNNSVEVLDLIASAWRRSIAGCSKPQGLVYLPRPNFLFVANGGDGRVRIYDGASFKPIVTVGGLEDADNLRYDAKLDRVYVGYGDGGIGVINPATGVLTVRIPFKGHPESFQIEQDGAYLFANVPDTQQIAVIDRHLRTVVESWPLNDFRANFPMALDEGNHRLFVGCRNPARLVVLDSKEGKRVADLPLSGDTDDLFYDGARRRIYASCGEGFIDVIEQRDANDYKPLEKISTAPGARTCLFSLDLSQLYLAVPRLRERPAEIRIYQVQP
jgi:DNA-binding beta-propeller fold protein YncE